MFYIDQYAYLSKLKNKDPVQKVIFASLTLIVCICANSKSVSVATILIMGWAIVRRGGIPLIVFSKLMLLPITFLLIGVFTIALQISSESLHSPFFVQFGQISFGLSLTGLNASINLFLKALGATSCLYFLSLSTPLVDLLYAFKRMKLPTLMVELMALVYRFVFLLLDTYENIFCAQNSRLGYANLRSAFRSMGILVASLFVRSYKKADEIYTALECRGFEGELNVLHEPYEKTLLGYIAPILVNCLLILLYCSRA